jgi:regulator of telomere elongation helicase 1
VGFKQILKLKPRSVILTSGTLSPLNSFEQELQVEFKQKLENPHVISADQVAIQVIGRSENNVNFNFTYQNKENFEMIDELGLTIAKTARNVPGGMLVFYPSYRMMDTCYERWERSGVLNKILQVKRLYREPKKAAEYQIIMDRYYSSIFEDDKPGAILMGVCRGRISEGLDFSDDAARCVVIVGIPYPQMTDPKVVLKKEYLDAKSARARSQANPGFGCLTGKDWYQQQATRSVNQAIGRVIRHVQDYGSILLLDERYTYAANKS